MKHNELTQLAYLNAVAHWHVVTPGPECAILCGACTLREARHVASKVTCRIVPNRNRDRRLSRALRRGGYAALNAA